MKALGLRSKEDKKREKARALTADVIRRKETRAREAERRLTRDRTDLELDDEEEALWSEGEPGECGIGGANLALTPRSVSTHSPLSSPLLPWPPLYSAAAPSRSPSPPAPHRGPRLSSLLSRGRASRTNRSQHSYKDDEQEEEEEEGVAEKPRARGRGGGASSTGGGGDPLSSLRALQRQLEDEGEDGDLDLMNQPPARKQQSQRRASHASSSLSAAAGAAPGVPSLSRATTTAAAAGPAPSAPSHRPAPRSSRDGGGGGGGGALRDSLEEELAGLQEAAAAADFQHRLSALEDSLREERKRRQEAERGVASLERTLLERVRRAEEVAEEAQHQAALYLEEVASLTKQLAAAKQQLGREKAARQEAERGLARARKAEEKAAAAAAGGSVGHGYEGTASLTFPSTQSHSISPNSHLCSLTSCHTAVLPIFL
jgi:hypothetical protein